jgi:Xaa-Pro aminopeptidase
LAAKDGPVPVRDLKDQGEETIERLLEEARGRLRQPDAGAEALRALIIGVLAAPEGPDPDAWMDLVVAGPGAALRERLASLKAALAAESGDGIDDDETPPARRLADLRRELKRRGIDGFIIPRSDEHRGEYVPLRARRLPWLAGFTGTAGMAVVLPEIAALFTDGRYTLQAKAEVDASLFLTLHSTERPAADWIAANLKPGHKVGFDPWLHTPDELTRLGTGCEKAGGELIACEDNPVDAVWSRQPPAPIAPIVAQLDAFAGKGSAEKRTEIAGQLMADGIDAQVLTLPASIAWLLNIRGGDVAYAPLPLAFAILGADAHVALFLDRRKLGPGLDAHLTDEVRIEDIDRFGPALDALGGEARRVQADAATAPAWVFDRLKAAGADIVKAADPCALPKACKNPVELDGIRAAHLRDGAALVRFLAWLSGEAPKGTLGEIAAADRLEALRRENDHFRGLSFPTISAAGPNGAIVHYQPSAKTNRLIEPGGIYLLDSGAQYLDGTTDVTRTLFISGGGVRPALEQRANFTRVLKGHIALAAARFPKGTSGSQLDTLARQALWRAGLDYDHGTGHGVGAYLGVHEGPQRIAKVPNTVALMPGMVVSNEPGYYKQGAYGIRIESLVTVRTSDANPGEERRMFEFETLTLAPIDLALVEADLLDTEEIAWLDAYHAGVAGALSPYLDGETMAWLADATRPVG